ncbi:hypothetical protein [Clostridium sp.]|uniref:hypothetical protein n=1 Tax=Clostridium sp. TaxID=1506 RepID=UPI0026275B73|nr:hypothetical protein [Clostridium sp.]
MENLRKFIVRFIVGAASLGIILFIIFHVIFTLGMINTNRPKSIRADIVSECVTDLKNSNKNFTLKDLELYYQQGKIHANIYFENDLSLEESKIVVKSLKEFLLKDNINEYFTENHNSLDIDAVIRSKDNSYYYECPYYLPTNDNSEVENNYKMWYLEKSSGEVIESINID